MRYYLYSSDAKVDMLLPQVPGALQQKVAAKLGFDLKLLSGSLETERKTFDNRVARLQVVEEHRTSSEQVGSPGQPASCIQGTSDAKLVDIGDGAILFLMGSQSWLLARGSAQHLIGASSPERLGIPVSFLPGLTQQLTKLVEKDPKYLLSLPEERLRSHLAPGASPEFGAWINVVRWTSEHSQAIAQRVQFLAKRLVTERTPGNLTVTLATPLYVSMAD